MTTSKPRDFLFCLTARRRTIGVGQRLYSVRQLCLPNEPEAAKGNSASSTMIILLA
jgi:hypothetical protein